MAAGRQSRQLCNFLRFSRGRYSTIKEEITHFGFETISKKEKSERVHHVFENVALKYDLMNDLMSGGIHRTWKDYFIRKINPCYGNKLLDVAGGTGDIAMRYLNFIKYNQWEKKKKEKWGEMSQGKRSEIIVCDINQAMLDVGKRKAKRFGIENDIAWVCGNGEALPFEDNTFDIYTIAFGIRNFTNVEKALEEAHRVLVPGGRFMCLEFSAVTTPIFERLYEMYSFQVIPVMGQIIAKDWDSYQYLVESIRQFPNQDEFASLIRDSGFRMVNYENLTFGVAAIHSAFKL
ncbi:2-methoxy-6-polyprenyl-1,4-benzoquinol methylase, mitochondrial-like [Dendronephthya gigantea]|uniref:2-methoxy-6-polyprenyl-1,4-benzoquinol methylase, mitochondrial-like n=1 Tax=Dendronephthya gigantea TaxID=151771 RepID=UPI00106C4553|nr:2-methoxy-6-polyprenyl-1,4-benzoquinol methylase, mitochondrial-like [Dendronephthya gigantea]XP_028418494.1 2-methoxy-6-polyprenyl-1,4-benzoquinol methylase, mitochondrial-like [Dendronephthya gigantea]XP_028418495.1 2-methoxy-6-polyprenyl-1,4-benzoquinol methylase, mitochondrial-like [Dendronephthya gigantea]